MTTYSKLTREQRDEFHQRAAKARENWGMDPNDYRRLAMISHQLHLWCVQESDGDIERCEEPGKVFRYYGRNQPDTPIRRFPARDMETGAIKRAQAICERNGGRFYYQSDPRGCAVYFWRSGEPGPRTIGPNEDIRQHYSTRALACFFLYGAGE